MYHTPTKDLYQEAMVLEINRHTKAEIIVIEQGLTEISVFEHNSIELLLKSDG